MEAYTRDNRLVAASAEKTAIPLAADKLGSVLEQAFSRKVVTLQDKIDIKPIERNVRQFGYDFFRNAQASAAVENVPVSGEYPVSAGDVLKIDAWGGLELHQELTVDRSGAITIPRVGTIQVAGQPFKGLHQTLERSIGRYFKDFQLNVTMGQMRSIRVFLVGALENPGAYSVSSLATVLNALAAAGGPSKNGSLRSVRVSRSGQPAFEVDLYDVLLEGNRASDLRLENGDTIHVPVIGPVAAVVGEVKRPAIYELKAGETLASVLKMAGGFTAASDTGRIQLERIEGSQSRTLIDIGPTAAGAGPQALAAPVQDRDLIRVFPLHPSLRKIVSLAGNVARPGEYQFRAGMRLRDVIPDPKLLLPDSYLEAAEITRIVPPDLHRERISFNLGRLLAGDQQENLELQEQDQIRINSRWDVVEKPYVTITGEVFKPGIYEYLPNMTVRDLIVAAGSLKRSAYLQDAELSRVTITPRGASSTITLVNLRDVLAGNPAQNRKLEPNDSLTVRVIPRWTETDERYVTISGEVLFPGTYAISKGERLSSVIARAGGLTEDAYPLGAKFTRKSVQKLQQQKMEEILTRTEQDILKKQSELASLSSTKEELEATRASLEALLKNLERLKNSTAEGRVVMRLEALLKGNDRSYDLELTGGDRLDIPKNPGVVSVMGQVFNPTTFIYRPDNSLQTYLKSAGGPTGDANQDEIYVIKPDGSVRSRQQSSFGLTWDPVDQRWTLGGFMAAAMNPGDTIVVPQKLERTAWMRDIKDITTILSQLAITAGTVFLGLR